MKNKNEKLDFLNGKTKTIRTFMFLLCFIFVLLLTYVVGTLLYLRNDFSGESTSTEINPDEYFKDCTLLSSKCVDETCRYYTQCGDQSYQDCRVYDCSNTYGVYTLDLEGKGHVNNDNPKPNLDVVKAQKEACQGDLSVLGEECVNGQTRLQVKIATAGDCQIGGFTLLFENMGAIAPDFVARGDGTYDITANSCGKLTTITPKTTGGISLELNRK